MPNGPFPSGQIPVDQHVGVNWPLGSVTNSSPANRIGSVFGTPVTNPPYTNNDWSRRASEQIVNIAIPCNVSHNDMSNFESEVLFIQHDSEKKSGSRMEKIITLSKLNALLRTAAMRDKYGKDQNTQRLRDHFSLHGSALTDQPPFEQDARDVYMISTRVKGPVNIPNVWQSDTMHYLHELSSLWIVAIRERMPDVQDTDLLFPLDPRNRSRLTEHNVYDREMDAEDAKDARRHSDYFWKFVPITVPRKVEPPPHLYCKLGQENDNDNFVGTAIYVGVITRLNGRPPQPQVLQARKAVYPASTRDNYRESLCSLQHVEVNFGMDQSNVKM